ncbi:unnamed protein product [Knipowitschia caucasica]|uniref:HMG box domain-containing protein n=1 Tax=Knipowitschia caucasica TaxID=637954 RepID=A0AAV2KUQ6_KNICA
MKRLQHRAENIYANEQRHVSQASSCKFQEFHWSLNNNGPDLSGVHPLVPLLIYSDRHFPPTSDPQPIRAHSDPQANSHSRIPCIHSNSTRRPMGAVKKPLNAFMLYMKEMRAAVRQEVNERESAAINCILGRKWNALSRAEQSKYFDLAQKERLLHLQLYPGWSARDNYGKRKRKDNHRKITHDSSS